MCQGNRVKRVTERDAGTFPLFIEVKTFPAPYTAWNYIVCMHLSKVMVNASARASVCLTQACDLMSCLHLEMVPRPAITLKPS